MISMHRIFDIQGHHDTMMPSLDIGYILQTVNPQKLCSFKKTKKYFIGALAFFENSVLISSNIIAKKWSNNYIL